jgi:hypothetical protein
VSSEQERRHSGTSQEAARRLPDKLESRVISMISPSLSCTTLSAHRQGTGFPDFPLGAWEEKHAAHNCYYRGPKT